MTDKKGLSHLTVKRDKPIKVYSQSVPLRHLLILYRFSISVLVK